MLHPLLDEKEEGSIHREVTVFNQPGLGWKLWLRVMMSFTLVMLKMMR